MKAIFFILLVTSAAAYGARTARDCWISMSLVDRISRFFLPWKTGEPISVPMPPPRLAVPDKKPWVLKRHNADPASNDYYNLHSLGQRPEYHALYEKLGIKIVKNDSIVPPAEVLNANLKAMGSPFQVVEVKGEIEFRPWMSLMADGKFPVGEKHDLMTHGIAVFMMPPEIANAYRASLKLLMALRAEPGLPEPLRAYLGEELGNLGKGFEVYSYAVAKVLNEQPAGKMDFAVLADRYASIAAFPGRPPIGGPARVARIKDRLRLERRRLGLGDLVPYNAFLERLDAIQAGLVREDAAFGLELDRKGVEGSVRGHFEKWLSLTP